jgi:hypothetical protein
MTPDDATARWIDLLAAQRAHHLARLHSLGRHTAFGALGVSFRESELAWTTLSWAAALFAVAGGFLALALHQERRDGAAAIACLDRAISELLSGSEARPVLTELSERMRRVAPPRTEAGPAPWVPSHLDGRWLGTRAFTKLCLASGALLLASVLLVTALILGAPPYSDEDGDYGSSATTDSHPRQHPLRRVGNEPLDFCLRLARGR